MSDPEQTLSRSDSDDAPPIGAPRSHLYVALDCDEPGLPGARICLGSANVVLIGRGARMGIEHGEADDARVVTIRLPNRRASSRHAELRKTIGVWVITDAGSKNGTLVNGEPIASTHLRPGDLVEVGNAFLRYDLDPPSTDVVVAHDDSGTATLHGPLAEAFAGLERIATTDTEVLIRGETGTGKELVARAVHRMSGRGGSFVPVNCGALPPTLVEAHLFGNLKGAYTGADDERLGLIRSAEGGTLLLDEIGDLPLPAQAALLRVLQERRVLPVGATESVPVDFRLVAATHRDLDAMVAGGTFREDLLARIAGFTFHIPPVRDRRCDLGLLIGGLLAELAADRAMSISADAARALLSYDWPRNVRELRNTLRSALALADDVIRVEHLPEAVRAADRVAAASIDEDAHEREQLIALLEEHSGNIAAVGRALGKARMQVYRDAKRLGVDVDSYRG